jgi:hypothetical protein
LDAVSVRELQGKYICEELGIKETQVLIDPTFLLTKEKWLNKVQKPKNLMNEKYVLTYYIGKIPENVNKEINRYCEENNGLKKIDLNSVDHLEYYSYTPFEFLYLILHSTVVYTDSFHATVFSIIFEKKFIVSERIIKDEEKMNSRIDTLLGLFGLEHHRFDEFSGDYGLLSLNGKKITEVIEKEQKRSKDFILEHIKEW